MRAAQAIDPDAARGAARDILRDRRFHRDPAPRPLRGPLQWLGDRLQTVVQEILQDKIYLDLEGNLKTREAYETDGTVSPSQAGTLDD